MTSDATSQTINNSLSSTRKPTSWRQIVLRQFLRNRGATIGAVLVLLVVLVALLAPMLAPYSPVEMHPKDRLRPPSAQYWMGTDHYGRDIFSRIVYGSRISLQVGILANLFSVILGMVIGLTAGFYGGAFDGIVMRFMDMIFAFPGTLLAISIIGLIGQRSLTWVMIAIAIVWIPMYARLIRGSVLSARELPYIEAARLIGVRDVRIMWRHILPNVVAPVLVVVTLCIGVAIRNTAALSFLGMGAQPPTPEWGLMLYETKQFMRMAPWVTIFPGMAILITVIGFNLIGDGLRTALDPRMKVD
jgi:peptide/nickel transport system permease protein